MRGAAELDLLLFADGHVKVGVFVELGPALFV